MCLTESRVDIFWEGVGPTDVSDRIHTSMPSFITKQIGKRLTKEVAAADKCAAPPSPRAVSLTDQLRHRELLDNLEKVGFRLGWGPEDAGFFYSSMTRGGGYYLGAYLPDPQHLHGVPC